MDRRNLLRLGLAGSAASLSMAGRPSAPVRIGVLLPVPGGDAYLTALRQGLDAGGWREARDYALAMRQADGTVATFRALGGELAALPVDVLVTASTAAATALAGVTATIPIVFVGVFDPVAAGLIASLDRPGGNLTGIAGFQAGIAADWVSLLREIAPRVERVVVLSNPASVAAAALAGWVAAAARVARVQEVHVDTVADIDGAVAGVARDPAAGIVVVPHTFPFANRAAVVAAMAVHRVPAIYGIAEMVRAGGLISYGQDLVAQWRAAAAYLVPIARGARPGDLPVRYAADYVLAINRAAAAALDLAVPPALIARAALVID